MFESFHRYKDIVWYRTLAQLKSESRQNYLGYVWFLLEPILTTAVLYLIFGIALGHRSSDFVFFLIVGLTVWQWFETSLTEGMVSIRAKLHIMNQIPLPKYLFPLVHIFASTWKFICVFAVLIIFTYFFGFSPNLNYIYLPSIFIAQLTLIIGLSLPLAVLNTYYADTFRVYHSVMRILFYVSGCFFSVEKVPADLHLLFYSNPMAGLITSYRSILIYNTPPSIALILYPFAFGLIFCIIGVIICNNIDKKLLKTVSL